MIRPGYVLGLFAAVGLYMASKTDQARTALELLASPRGIRNHNPGNIRHNSANAWKGAALEQLDKAFVQFTAPQWGVRALGRVLMSYERAGLHTVSEIIGRWAPPLENLTGAYTRAVAHELGVDPGASIDVRAQLGKLAAAIIRHENGQQPYAATDLQQWVNLA